MTKQIKNFENPEQLLKENLNIPADIIRKDFTESVILHRASKEVKYATEA